MVSNVFIRQISEWGHLVAFMHARIKYGVLQGSMLGTMLFGLSVIYRTYFIKTWIFIVRTTLDGSAWHEAGVCFYKRHEQSACKRAESKELKSQQDTKDTKTQPLPHSCQYDANTSSVCLSSACWRLTVLNIICSEVSTTGWEWSGIFF